MADQQNRSGQKRGNLDPEQHKRKKRSATQGAGERSDRDKREDQMNNPDDTTRQPTDE